LTLAAVTQRCAQETELFFQRQAHDSRYCFELFRRAILEHDQSAWEMIHIQYQSLVSGWIQRHPAFESSGEEVQYFVNRAFEKIWAALTPEKFSRFLELKPLLLYLKMCVHSVIVDHNRLAEQFVWNAGPEEPALDSIAYEVILEDQAMEPVYRQQFWAWINSQLHDEKERLVIHGSFVLALKPRELYDRSQLMFEDVDEVYRIKQNVLARFRRDPEFKRIRNDYA
jgi:hypothetical protein